MKDFSYKLLDSVLQNKSNKDNIKKNYLPKFSGWGHSPSGQGSYDSIEHRI